jgi:hypothetical protein
MPKFNFNYSELNQIVIPNLSETSNHLNDAIKEITQVRVPPRFRYATTVRELDDLLRNIDKELIKVKDWLIFTNKKLDEEVENTESILHSIKDIEIKKRDMIVK